MRRYLQGVLFFCCTLALVSHAQSSAICDSPGLDIPKVECQALMSIYTSMNGASWLDHSNWGISTTTGEWYGVSVWGGHVRGIYLYESGLQGDFAITQGNLNFVDTVYLYRNQITGFDATGFASLQTLDLGWNQLSSFDGTNLPNLYTLYLNDNNLTIFSGQGLSNLQFLYLYNNQIIGLDTTDLTNLLTLDLYNNDLTSFSGEGLPSLMFLDIRNNDLTSFNNETALSNISYVNIANNNLTNTSSTLANWFNQYAEYDWSQTQGSPQPPTNPSGGSGSSSGSESSSNTDSGSDSNPPSDSGSSSSTDAVCGNGIVDAGEACESSINPVCENGYTCSGCQCYPPPSITIPPSDSNPPPTTIPSSTTADAECGAEKFTCDVGGVEQQATTDLEWTWKCYVPGDPDGMASCSKKRPAECGATHFDCTRGGSEQNVTTDTEWTWKCYVAGDPNNMASCSEKRPGECGLNLNTCKRGGLIDHPDTATTYEWECYVGGTNPAWCSLAKPICGAAKFTCDGGTSGAQVSTPISHTWTCTSQDQSVNCLLDRPECGGVINGCNRGVFVDALDNIPTPATHNWSCVVGIGVNSETATCRIRDGICGAGIYACNYSSFFGLAINTGFTPNSFTWNCPGDIGGATAVCTFICPGNQVVDPVGNRCIDPPTDLCNNIAGIQNPLPAGMTRFPSGNCCANPQIWNTATNTCANPLVVTCSANPLSTTVGQNVSWTANPSGGIGGYLYNWSGSEGLTGVSAATNKTYALSGQKTAIVTVTSGSQTAVASCTVAINALPDLTTTITAPITATVDIPRIFTTTVTSANAGTGVGFNNLFQVATLPNGGGTISVISVNPTAALAAGASRSVSSSAYTFTSAGPYSVRACADNNAAFVSVVTESNEANNCSPTWTTVTVLPPPPATPTGLSVTPSACNNNWLNISWNASLGATSYQVYRGATKVYDGPLLAFSDLGLTPGSTYSYTITASNTGGTSAISSPAISGQVSFSCIIPTVITPTVTSVAASSAILGANVTSLGIPAAISARGTCWGTIPNPLTNCAPHGTFTTGIFTHSRIGLSPGTTYYYRGYATNTTGTGYSPDATFTTPTPTGTLTASACTILKGQSTCNTTLDWHTYNPTLGLSQVTTPVALVVATSNDTPVGGQTYEVEHGERTFYLYHSLIDPLATAKATASCEEGTVWDGDSCEEPIVLSGTLTATDCFISKGQSTCNTTLDWHTYNPTLGLSQVTTPVALVVATSNDTPVGGQTYPIERGTRSFYLYHGSELATDTATASCDPTTGWDVAKGKCDQYAIIYHENGNNDVSGVVPTGFGYFPTDLAIIEGPGTLDRTGYIFSGWNTSANGTGDSYSPGNTIAMSQDINLYAQWTPSAYTLVANKNGTGAIKKDGSDFTSQVFPIDTPVTLTAVGATFEDWTGCDFLSGSTNEICHVTMDDNKTVTATFAGAPALLDGCFADDNTGKNLTNYKGNLIDGAGGIYGLLKRVGAGGNLGYILTDSNRASQTQTFRTRLAGNINKYITSRYLTRPITDTDKTWNATDAFRAPIKTLTGAPGAPNPSGYFYYTGSSSFPLFTLSQAAVGDIIISKPTVLYVTGADIYIQKNITYNTAGEYPSLVIIAQKDSSNIGGNIYVDPAVTHIDGTLIADGALMNWNGIKEADGNIWPFNWINEQDGLQNRLLVNGRLLTYNTRGGSLKVENGNLQMLKGGGNTPETLNIGWCIDSKTFTTYNCNWQDAAAQDLERFRMVPTGTDKTCSLYITNNIPQRKPDILTTILD